MQRQLEFERRKFERRGSARGGRSTASSGSSSLLDRFSERRAIDQLLGATRLGDSGVLVLHGELGIGKTMLLDYAAASAAGMRVVCVAGAEAEANLSFAALHQLLAPLLSELNDLPAPQTEALSTAFGLTESHPPDPFLVGLGALGLLSTAADRKRLLCVVDDAQWLDDASAEILAFVIRRLAAEGIAFLISAESLDQTPLGVLPSLRVEGLPEESARQLLELQTAGRLDSRVADRVVADTRGNPLALLQVSAELTPAQLSGDVGLPEPLPVVPGLERSILARVMRLPEETRSLLLLAAAEPDGDVNLILRATRRLGIRSVAGPLAQVAGILLVEEAMVFTDASFPAAIYASASAEERRRVHRALAESIDLTTDPGKHAWHLAAASVGPDELVASALQRSVQQAREQGGYAKAGLLLQRAAELTPDPRRRIDRLLAAVRAYFETGSATQASALLAEIPAALASERQRGQEQLLRGLIDLELGGGDAHETLLQAALALEPLDAELANEAHLEALAAAIWAGPLAGGGDVEKAARAALHAPRFARPVTAGRDLLLEGFALLFTEGHSVAIPKLRAAIEALRNDDDLRWARLTFHAAYEIWDDEAMHAMATRRVQLARDTGEVAMLPTVLSHLGEYEVLAGRFHAAETRFDEAREISTTMDHPGILGEADPGALLLPAWLGDEAETRALAELCAREATAWGLGIFAAFAQYALAVLELGLGHYHPALIAAHEASEETLVAPRALPELVEAAVRCGELDVAAKAVQELADVAVASGTEWALGILARSRALVAEAGQAEGLYRESIDRLRRCRATPHLARSKLLYGEWLRRRRRRLDAREQLRLAYQMLSSMGAGGFAERAGIELVATGEQARQRTSEARQALTPQEAHIARLASEGASNSEIAAQFHISPRTVEYHLSKVFRKLGISRRAQLAHELHETHAAGVQ